jgi:hypothetical protein
MRPVRSPAGRRRLKWARKTLASSATNGASPSLDLNEEENRDGETILPDDSKGRSRRRPFGVHWSALRRRGCAAGTGRGGRRELRFDPFHNCANSASAIAIMPRRQYYIILTPSVNTYDKRQIRGPRRARTVVMRLGRYEGQRLGNGAASPWNRSKRTREWRL